MATLAFNFNTLNNINNNIFNLNAFIYFESIEMTHIKLDNEKAIDDVNRIKLLFIHN